MKEIYEVRMHARAGQGAKSGSQLLAESAFKLGKWIQSFPEYGSERRGAPTVSYINTTKSVEEMKKITGFNGKIYTLDATGISLKLLDVDAPNVPMLGALIKITNIVPLKIVEDVIKEHFLVRLGEEKVKKNKEGLRKAWEEASS